MDLDPLHDLGEGEVSHSVIGDNVHQHSGLFSADVRRRGDQLLSRLSKSDATGPSMKVTRTFYVFTRAAVYRGGRCDEGGEAGRGDKPAASRAKWFPTPTAVGGSL
jgi:hypothetical protein